MDPVVVGTDGSEDSLRAVEWAAREATLHGTSLQVASVPLVPPRMTPDPAGRQTVAGLAYEAARGALDAAAARATGVEPGLAVSTELLRGSPAQALTELAAGASMLVVGSRGIGGFAAMTLGSVSRYVATHAAVPVVVAREETMAVHREIVAGVRDPSESADVLAFAFAEAALRRARLVAFHAWTLPLVPSKRPMSDPDEISAEAATVLEQALAGWREKYPDVRTGWEVMHAHPGRVLAGASARADLVVLGRRDGRGGAGAASVIHAVLNHAHGPIACVPVRL
jgi:nucleotide-binding universal stress UspA family protein